MTQIQQPRRQVTAKPTPVKAEPMSEPIRRGPGIGDDHELSIKVMRERPNPEDGKLPRSHT